NAWLILLLRTQLSELGAIATKAVSMSEQIIDEEGGQVWAITKQPDAPWLRRKQAGKDVLVATFSFKVSTKYGLVGEGDDVGVNFAPRG
ncbi:hypothetical protein NL360_27985, partial [Klebsiella pneumoniae]|nr:hypothetical protein [Klebsiella pneumoniae]